MNPGDMRERVTVQIATGTTNALGEQVLSWSNSSAVWASVEGVSASEALRAGQQDTTVTHTLRMRYVQGLTQSMRFAWRGRTLNIVSLLEHQNRTVHEAICAENSNG